MEKVIYMNTFTKSLAPTIRISYMVLPQHLLEAFRQRLGFYACTVSTFEQYTLARFLGEGYFEKHINRMRNYYRSLRDALLTGIRESPMAAFPISGRRRRACIFCFRSEPDCRTGRSSAGRQSAASVSPAFRSIIMRPKPRRSIR